jgi:ArsR family transcriptional regulator
VSPERCEVPPAANDAPALDDERLAAMARALGHPTRLRILRLLIERNACITGDLVALLPLAQSTVSEHLRILREAGLIRGEISGPRTSYCVDRSALEAVVRALGTLLEAPGSAPST